MPAVAATVGAPAFAASCGSTTYDWRLDWGASTGLTYGTNKTTPVHIGTAVITGPAGSSPITVTFTNSVVGADRRHPTNLTVENTFDIGDLGATEKGLLLWNTNILAGRDASRQVVTVTFSRPVTDLQFTITDIDSNDQNGSNSDYRDEIELSGTRTAVATSRGGGNFYVVGSGTSADPWHMYNDDTAASDSGDNRGNLQVAYTGSVSTFEMNYWNSRGNGQQAVFLGDFTFKSQGC